MDIRITRKLVRKAASAKMSAVYCRRVSSLFKAGKISNLPNWIIPAIKGASAKRLLVLQLLKAHASSAEQKFRIIFDVICKHLRMSLLITHRSRRACMRHFSDIPASSQEGVRTIALLQNVFDKECESIRSRHSIKIAKLQGVYTPYVRRKVTQQPIAADLPEPHATSPRPLDQPPMQLGDRCTIDTDMFPAVAKAIRMASRRAFTIANFDKLLEECHSHTAIAIGCHLSDAERSLLQLGPKFSPTPSAKNLIVNTLASVSRSGIVRHIPTAPDALFREVYRTSKSDNLSISQRKALKDLRDGDRWVVHRDRGVGFVVLPRDYVIGEGSRLITSLGDVFEKIPAREAVDLINEAADVLGRRPHLLARQDGRAGDTSAVRGPGRVRNYFGVPHGAPLAKISKEKSMPENLGDVSLRITISGREYPSFFLHPAVLGFFEGLSNCDPFSAAEGGEQIAAALASKVFPRGSRVTKRDAEKAFWAVRERTVQRALRRQAIRLGIPLPRDVTWDDIDNVVHACFLEAAFHWDKDYYRMNGLNMGSKASCALAKVCVLDDLHAVTESMAARGEEFSPCFVSAFVDDVVNIDTPLNANKFWNELDRLSSFKWTQENPERFLDVALDPNDGPNGTFFTTTIACRPEKGLGSSCITSSFAPNRFKRAILRSAVRRVLLMIGPNASSDDPHPLSSHGRLTNALVQCFVDARIQGFSNGECLQTSLASARDIFPLCCAPVAWSSLCSNANPLRLPAREYTERTESPSEWYSVPYCGDESVLHRVRNYLSERPKYGGAPWPNITWGHCINLKNIFASPALSMSGLHDPLASRFCVYMFEGILEDGGRGACAIGQTGAPGVFTRKLAHTNEFTNSTTGYGRFLSVNWVAPKILAKRIHDFCSLEHVEALYILTAPQVCVTCPSRSIPACVLSAWRNAIRVRRDVPIRRNVRWASLIGGGMESNTTAPTDPTDSTLFGVDGFSNRWDDSPPSRARGRTRASQRDRGRTMAARTTRGIDNPPSGNPAGATHGTTTTALGTTDTAHAATAAAAAAAAATAAAAAAPTASAATPGDQSMPGAAERVAALFSSAATAALTAHRQATHPTRTTRIHEYPRDHVVPATDVSSGSDDEHCFRIPPAQVVQPGGEELPRSETSLFATCADCTVAGTIASALCPLHYAMRYRAGSHAHLPKELGVWPDDIFAKYTAAMSTPPPGRAGMSAYQYYNHLVRLRANALGFRVDLGASTRSTQSVASDNWCARLSIAAGVFGYGRRDAFRVNRLAVSFMDNLPRWAWSSSEARDDWLLSQSVPGTSADDLFIEAAAISIGCRILVVHGFTDGGVVAFGQTTACTIVLAYVGHPNHYVVVMPSVERVKAVIAAFERDAESSDPPPIRVSRAADVDRQPPPDPQGVAKPAPKGAAARRSSIGGRSTSSQRSGRGRSGRGGGSWCRKHRAAYAGTACPLC